MRNNVLLMIAIMTILLVSCKQDLVNDPESNNLVPTVTTDTAANITPYSAVVYGTINLHGIPCSYYFEYGSTASYGNQITAKNLDIVRALHTVSDTILHLQPENVFHYRIVCSNTNGTSKGEDQFFTTIKNDYFPQTQGSRWVYSFFDAVNVRSDTVEVNITGSGIWQYSAYSGTSAYPAYTEEVTVTPGMVQMNSNITESRTYMIPFAHGNTWNGPPPQYSFVHYSVSKQDSIITPAGIFYGAFLINMTAFNGGNTTYTDERVFVPQIGFVRRNESVTGTAIGTVSSYNWNLISVTIKE